MNGPAGGPGTVPAGLVRKTARAGLTIIAILWFVIDELVWRQVQASFAWLHRLKLLSRLEERLRVLPPYGALALFILPAAITFPAKIMALWLSVSSPLLGGIAFVSAKLLSSALGAWIYRVVRDRILEIGWFRPLHDRVLGWHAAIVGQIRDIWQGSAAQRAIQAVRSALRTAMTRVRRMMTGKM
ncbi:MAG: hypothetical protein R3C97_19130 [Geminicoccaceae bacterium]